MERVLNAVAREELSGVNVGQLTRGKAIIRQYDAFATDAPFLSLLGPQHACIVLVPVDSNTSGHWTALWYNEHENALHFFDSYGFTLDQEIPYSHMEDVKERLLQQRIAQFQKESGCSYTVNRYKLQTQQADDQTCGRHACCRILFDFLSDEEYAQMLMNQKWTPDQIVCCMTFITVDLDGEGQGLVRKLVHA